MEPIGFLAITLPELRGIVREAVNEVLAAREPKQQQSKDESPQYDLLTRKETAALLHVSVLTLRKWEIRGVLRPRRVSRRVLYVRSEVLAALKRIGESHKR